MLIKQWQTWLRGWEANLSIKARPNTPPFEEAVSHPRGALMAGLSPERERSGERLDREREKRWKIGGAATFSGLIGKLVATTDGDSKCMFFGECYW